MALTVGSVVAQFKSDLSDFKKGLSEARDNISSFSNSTVSALKGAEEGSKKFALALTAGVTALAGAIGYGAKVAGDLEAARQGFVALLGSAEKADATMARIKREAAATPFEITGLVTGTQALTAITKDGNKAIDVLLDVGKAVAISGKGQAELDRVVFNLQQISATGKVTAMDIRQFQSAIPIFNDIVEASGMTVAELQNADNAAELLFEAFKKAGSEGGISAAGFTAQAGTFNQLMSNMKDNITILSSEIVKETGIFDGLKGAISKINEVLGNQDNIIPTIKSFFEFLQKYGIIIATAITFALIPAFVGLAGSLMATMIPLFPFIAAGIALGAVITGIVYVVKHWGEIMDWVKDKIEIAKNAIANAFAPVIEKVTGAFDNFVSWLQGIPGAIESFINGIIDTIRAGFEWVGGIFEMVWAKITEGFNAFVGFLVSIATAIWNVIKIVASPFVWLHQNIVEPIMLLIQAIILRVFYEIFTFIVGTMTALIDFLVNSVFIPIYDFFVYWFTAIWSWLVWLWTTVTTWLQNVIFNPLRDFILFWLTQIYNFFVENFTKLKNWINETLTFIKDNIFMPIFTAIKDFVVMIWESIVDFTKKAWEWIKQHILAPLNEAKEGAKTTTTGILDWIKNTWNNIVDFLVNLKDKIVDAIVKPFREAKQQVEEWAQKIRDAADKINPFHRESPSLVDKVQAGVAAIKDAYASLGDNFQVPQVAGLGVGTGGGNVITISMAGANITDISVAEEYAEAIGDKLIRRLTKVNRV